MPSKKYNKFPAHLVKVNQKEKQQYCCDDKCPMFKGFLICAHTVAAAQVNGELECFVKWYVTNKCRANLASIAQEGMPKCVGRKGAVPKRKRLPHTPVESSSSQCFVQDSSEPNPKHLTVTSAATVTPYTSVSTVLPAPLPVSASVAQSYQFAGTGQLTTASSSILYHQYLLHRYKILPTF